MNEEIRKDLKKLEGDIAEHKKQLRRLDSRVDDFRSETERLRRDVVKKQQAKRKN